MAPFKKTGVVPNKKIRNLVEGLSVAMLSTISADGSLMTRPVPMTNKSFDGGFWVFIDRLSPLVSAIGKGQTSAYSLHFSSETDKRFLSAEGNVKVVTEKKIKTKLWNDDLLHWFSDGVADPDLCLLRMEVTKANYWEPSLREMVELDLHTIEEPAFHPNAPEVSNTAQSPPKSSFQVPPLSTQQTV
ncbi:MAG: pyridoxamine 5'-phosphate oxidase family protein [Pseudobdellovibrionaceae bacterium]